MSITLTYQYCILIENMLLKTTLIKWPKRIELAYGTWLSPAHISLAALT
jgi:hypothetical protein